MDKKTKEELVKFIKECDYFNNFTILRGVDTSEITDFSFLFKNCSNLRNIDFAKKWDLSNAETLEGMFENCQSLEDIDGCVHWHTKHLPISKMKRIFKGVNKLDLVSKILFLKKEYGNSFIEETLKHATKNELENIYGSLVYRAETTPH